jgi:MFS superfamily sulfate permease-like transporter
MVEAALTHWRQWGHFLLRLLLPVFLLRFAWWTPRSVALPASAAAIALLPIAWSLLGTIEIISTGPEWASSFRLLSVDLSEILQILACLVVAALAASEDTESAASNPSPS